MPTREKLLWVIVTATLVLTCANTFFIYRIYDHLHSVVGLIEKTIELDEKKDEIVDTAVGMIQHLFGEDE